MASDSSDAQKVSAFWGRDRRSERKHNWLEHPTALQCLNQRRAGDPNTDLAGYWRRTFLQSPAPVALSVGCGFGLWERIALQQNLVSKIYAYDVSENAITEARKLAVEAGLGDRVTYAVADLNTIDLPTTHYDAIFGISSLHHVQNLERLFEQCRRALKPGGLFFLDEYVGPKRFQSNPRVVQLINDVIRALPEKYRRSVYLNGEARNTYANTPLSWFEETDPSEAIRSDDILPCLKQHFDIIDEKPYGGALLHMLLSGTAGNFDPENEEDAAMIRLLALFEEEMEKSGAIGTDFATVVAKPKP